MNEQPTTPSDDASATPAPQPSVNRGRRRLGALGITGTAVALSVTSRSAVAGWGTCTGSELASGNLSRADTANPCGCSPGFWWNRNGKALWDSSPTLKNNFPRATAEFNTTFGVDFYNKKADGTAVRLKDVGPSTKNDNKYGANDNTGMHAVAALLNAQYYGARYPVSGMQTAAAVKTAFQLAVTNGTFTDFVSKVDIYASTANLWCSGKEE